jgi:hypothetical protein
MSGYARMSRRQDMGCADTGWPVRAEASAQTRSDR